MNKKEFVVRYVEVAKEGEVGFSGFGKFYKAMQGERRSVVNGKEVITPQKEVVRFKKGSKLKI